MEVYFEGPKIWKAKLTWNCPSVKVLLGNAPGNTGVKITWNCPSIRVSYLEVTLTIWGTSLALHKDVSPTPFAAANMAQSTILCFYYAFA